MRSPAAVNPPGLVVGAMHASGVVAEQLPHPADPKPTHEKASSWQPERCQPSSPGTIDQNPFSASFGRPSGTLAQGASHDRNAAAPNASAAVADAEGADDQNPFAAFVDFRPAGFRAPQIQLPDDIGSDTSHGPLPGQEQAPSGSRPGPEPSQSELGGAPGAAVVLDCSLRGVEVKVPWDQDPGAAIRFTELWGKAFKQVVPQSR